ncbi:MAG: transketolase [Planctomycetota bacterium]|jgi:transketolase|nr:transketolase [Planctomycetota bacterium]
MRNAFIDELLILARRDPRIVALSSDIGNRMFDRFAAACPGRFINTGIAEAGMTGIAAGLALAGLRPFTYTIASFNPGRCLEQIRLDLCQPNLPVTLVGIGAGLSYASLGPTHHALEDMAWLRAIPNMTIVCPGDPLETRAAVRAALAQDGPLYIRLGKKGEPVCHRNIPEFRIGKAIEIKSGSDAVLLAVGTTLPLALAAAERLAEMGITAAVHSFHTVKPLDGELLGSIFSRTAPVAVIEEHAPAGGAWSGIAEWLAERGGGRAPLLRFGTPDAFFHEAGGQDWARKRSGLEAGVIASRISEVLSSRAGEKRAAPL